MSSDEGGDGERRMAFTDENDFEGGQWIGGEYYGTQRKGRIQTADEKLYGVFADGSSDDERGRRHGKSDKARLKLRPPKDMSRPVDFVGGAGKGNAPQGVERGVTEGEQDMELDSDDHVTDG
ncbi:unnamed protein product, partial [Discosporangium mesarthrocarpum]